MIKYEQDLSARVNGNNLQPLAGAEVRVTDKATGLPAALYQDDELTPIPQPLVTTNTGYFGFKAANGEYELRFSPGSNSSRFDGFTRDCELYDADDVPNPVSVVLSSLGAEDGAGKVGYKGRKVSDKLGEMPSVTDFGTDQAAFMGAFTAHNAVRIPAGEYVIETGRIGEFQKPLNVVGDGASTVIRIGATNADKTAFRVGAVGGAFHEPRAITKYTDLTFKPPADAVAPYAYTGIDVQSTHPIVLRDDAMISMGPGAVKMKAIYYGYSDGLVLVNSGLMLEDVNNIEFSGGDIRANDFTDTSGGAALFGNVGRYPVEMLESDLIKFTDTTFEDWKVPVFKFTRCYNPTFNGSWIEGCGSNSHIIKMEQSQSLTFNNSQLDFAVPYADCFIRIDNSGPVADENQRWNTSVNINGGYLLLMSTSFGNAPEFIKTTNGEPCHVLVDAAAAFRGGSLYASRSVEFDVRSILLNGAYKHNFYSKPNAQLLPRFNSWMPKSASLNWDFAAGANFTATGGLTVATTTVEGEYLTGTRGVKVTGIPSDNAKYTVQRITTGEMGPVTAEGQTYLAFVRVKCDRDVLLNFNINGGYADFAETPNTELPANTWRDYVLKTQEDVTWAQGRFFDPAVMVSVTNNSGADATLYINRIDYMICNGDHQI